MNWNDIEKYAEKLLAKTIDDPEAKVLNSLVNFQKNKSDSELEGDKQQKTLEFIEDVLKKVAKGK